MNLLNHGLKDNMIISLQEENSRRQREAEYMRKRLTGQDSIMRIMAIDLAKSVDYSFITISERRGDQHLFRHLERIPPGMDYPDQVHRFVKLTKYSHIDRVVIDRTGIGMAVYDLLIKAGIRPIGVVITSGNEPNFKGNIWSVPKPDLISSLIACFQLGHIRIADLPERKTLITELQNFQIKISKNGHAAYEAAGSTIHDDGVISAALAVYSSMRLYRRNSLNFEDAKGYGGLSL